MKRKIIAVTACATGVAHTYMAAQALKKGAKKMDNLIKVETQGATGIENELTEKDVNIGEVVIFAVDTKVRNMERFAGKTILEVPVSAPIKDAEKVINAALKLIDEK
ncbi:PTS fructose transporter subunit IIB [Paenilisteria rocourtiae]|uniref:PTS system IIB component (Fru family) n=1 Tax=Listeria rocourtiae TaxID=647910 RepID=A0A4R6ZG88_9LIST|nr:PTS fructose transporter subunit IIB [Listeria rocourtiae]EUJ44794.1 PTS system fructose-specific transporter subunit IIB [Listeria rocourtiae FSL F6-920]TDR51190.1 PTS system IIB component (Fru family) [Listeria rocourtiae]